MFADAEIPVGVPDPVDVQLVAEIKTGPELGMAKKLVENDPVIDAFDPDLTPIALIKKLAAAFPDLRQANGMDSEPAPRVGEINPGFLLLRLDLEQDDVLRVGLNPR
jgi:hypothetical protein